MTNALVDVERQGRVAIVTWTGRHPLNPLADDLIDELGRTLREIDASSDVHATVLRGAGRAFAAGADIDAMSRLDYAAAFGMDYIGRNWEVVRTHRKPLIAAVHGYALGGGCELAMMCDVVVAAENAVFGQPEVRLGIVPGAGGTQRLPRAVGKSLAMEMCLTGASIDARQALAAGLVSRVVPEAALLDAAVSIAQAIAAHSLPVVMAIKESVNRAFESSLHEGLLFERRAFHAGFSLSDQKEGMRAFLDKRAPSFEQR